MHWEQKVQYASISDVGFRRRNNEDACITHLCPDQESWSAHGHLFLVADGMGGHAVGELASKIAADTVPHTYYKSAETDPSECLRDAIERANAAIHERSVHNRDFERMGTTCTALALTPHGAIIGHVGDSRVYRVRGDRIDQLSFDHSLQWEMLRQGETKPEELVIQQPRNVITRSLGPEEHVNVDVEGPYEVLPGDVFILCSDGLTSHVNDAEIGMLARLLPPPDSCRLLVNLANLRGGSDNITVVVARIGELPEGVEPAELPHHGGEGLSWWWLGGFWLMALTFVVSLLLPLMGHPNLGRLLSAFVVIAIGAALLTWLRRKPAGEDSGAGGKGRTRQQSRPYTTASAKLTPQFLAHLAAVETELQRTATEEGWTLDWNKHNRAYEKAEQALATRQYSQACLMLGRSIDVLMNGVHAYRKQIHRDMRWGKPAGGRPKSQSPAPQEQGPGES